MGPKPPDDVLDGPPSGTVHLWWFSLADDADSPPSPLDADDSLQDWEQQRAAKFATPLLRRRYVQSHAGLRHVLARYLAQPARRVRLEREAYGKPRLADGAPRQLLFNLSHSAGRAVVAVRSRGAVGVDLERIRTDLDFAGVGRQVFTPEELASCRDASGVFREEDWFQLWTLKEAGLKAIGRGMLMQPQRLAVAPGRRSIAVDTAADPRLTTQLAAAPVDCTPGWSAAVASLEPFDAVQQYDLHAWIE